MNCCAAAGRRKEEVAEANVCDKNGKEAKGASTTIRMREVRVSAGIVF